MKRELEMKYRTILQHQLRKGVITERKYKKEVKFINKLKKQ
jgi:hypothetical protein